MISKPLAVGLLAASCVTAAAGGAYVAVRQNAASTPIAYGAAAPAQRAEAAGTPVSETEALVAPSVTPSAAPATKRAVEQPAVPAEPPSSSIEQPRVTRKPAQTAARPKRSAPAIDRSASASAPSPATSPVPASPDVPVQPPPQLPVEAARPEPPPAPPAPQFEELIVPSASVVGLHMETTVSSERAQVEDRVDARVTRDVIAEGRVAIPAGTRAIGAVTVVERGGKVKERARLGVRFHTLVLADGTELPIRTEAVFREGDSPSGESARKIGGAAIGGAILGAIMGGGKGAALGGAAGAAGGTAAVMAGDRNAATLPAGTVVTVRLAAPITLQVEKQ